MWILFGIKSKQVTKAKNDGAKEIFDQADSALWIN